MLSELGPWEKASVAQTQRTKATQQDLCNHILVHRSNGISYIPHSSAPRIGNLWVLFIKSLCCSLHTSSCGAVVAQQIANLLVLGSIPSASWWLNFCMLHTIYKVVVLFLRMCLFCLSLFSKVFLFLTLWDRLTYVYTFPLKFTLTSGLTPLMLFFSFFSFWLFCPYNEF